MPVPDQEHVRRVLAPAHDVLRTIVEEAWDAWMTHPENSVFRFGRTRACIVWEHMVRLAESRLAALPGIVTIPRHESMGWLFADSVYLRFKKANEKGLSHNYPTKLALDFHDHEKQLPGIQAATRVEVVYLLDELETEVVDILVVCRDAKQIAWSYSLQPQQQNIISLPTAPRPQSASKPSLVKLRRPEQEGDADERDSS